MPFAHWITVAALAMLPLAAVAQTANRQPEPTDPDTSVPAFIYQSAFREYRPMTDAKIPPDKTWRGANDDMQGLGGHAGHIKESGAVNPSPFASVPAHHGMKHLQEGK